MRISILVSSLSALLIFPILFIFYNDYRNLNSFQIAILISLISICLGIHGIHHYYEEIYFNFNPLVGKWAINDDVQNENKKLV